MASLYVATQKLLSILKHIVNGRLPASFALWSLRRAYQDRPVPIENLLRIRRFFGGEDVLWPFPSRIVKSGANLSNPYLATQLAAIELGRWSLDVQTLNHLEGWIKANQPSTILELGSGFSTVCLCQYMLEAHDGQRGEYIISIEQDEAFAKRTRTLLRDTGLDDYAKIVSCPLRKQVIEGIETICYDLSNCGVAEALQGGKPDMVVVDGPTDGNFVRFGTLPQAKQYVQLPAQFFLDDALRDDELQVAEAWSGLPYIEIEGVWLIGKGVMTGRIYSS